ncbi:MAG: ATP-dependent helicase RecG [Haloplasmataceae bacterium]|nr:ATP-dependent helicase RecG [Haloplasmataceae bacterium]
MNKLIEVKVNEIKGISKKMIEHLNELEIFTIYDLFYYLPYRYENYEVANIHTVNTDDKITVIGQVVTEPVFNYFGARKSRLIFNIVVDDVIIKITAFNRDFLRGKISKGNHVTITGKFDKNKAQIVASELRLSKLENDRVEPVYSLKSLKKPFFLNVLKKALAQFESLINDELPLSLINKYRLISNKDVFTFAHFPVNNEQIRQVMRRIKYEELLKFQLKIYYLKEKEHKTNLKELKVFNPTDINNFIKNLPFELTGDQINVCNEILHDLKSEFQMNRLVQGDVGSGKTVVAAIALYANNLAGYQGCIMAPTEILAEQHYDYFRNLFSHLSVRLLTSSTSTKNRNLILTELNENKIDILVGTHALISEGVTYHKLGLIIIDEQHRFGVNQRKSLREKGGTPDALFLSATPIPRTLALSVFGDMDVSSIKQMPKGRKVVKTYLIKSKLEDRLVKFIDQAASLGQQVYIVTPLIDESEKMDLENAISVYEKYKTLFMGKYNVGLLHGKLSNDEKEKVMHEFKNNQIHVLVSTTVVEVGVNVSNATLMVIIDAERFGLAQLHQLRGRVGRSDLQSYCILVSDFQNDKTQNRLEIMTKTNDGFEIAEEDLKIRGPGDFFGSRQSGLPKFKMADIVNDFKILEVARDDAKVIVETKELMINPEYFALRYYIERQIIENNELFD